MRSEAEAERAVGLYADTVRRVLFLYLKNHHDTEDVFQDVFLKYILSDKHFDCDAHERSWLIRVAVNRCKDILKSHFWRRFEPLNDVASVQLDESSDLLYAVMELPRKYREVLYLHYYEGYKAAEISKILNTGENTVYTRLSRARQILKEKLGGEYLDR